MKHIEKNDINDCTDIWRLPRLSELTPIIFYTELTHLDSEVYIYKTSNMNILYKRYLIKTSIEIVSIW